MKLTTIHTNIQTKGTFIEHALSLYIMSIIIYELVHDLRDHVDDVAEKFRRKFSHWCFFFFCIRDCKFTLDALLC